VGKLVRCPSMLTEELAKICMLLTKAPLQSCYHCKLQILIPSVTKTNTSITRFYTVNVSCTLQVVIYM